MADAIEDRMAVGGRDIGDVLVELCNDGLVPHSRLNALITELETVITLSEGPISESRLQVVGEIGRGAMGYVHAARDTALGRNVAVKKMDPAALHNPILLGRFKAEAQITAQLDHPGIVPVYGLSSDARGVPSYSMKLIRGQTLTAFLDVAAAVYRSGARPDEDHDLNARLNVFVQTCNAVAYAHARGVLHRDLKPDNVMLGAFHEVLVVDWGVAKLIGASEETLEGMPSSTGGDGTELGTVIGTPHYCSPEQARGENATLTAASDQYALGLILYELVTLTRALRGKTSYLVLLKASAGDTAPMRHVAGATLPRELVAIVNRATALEPADRYPSVEALADDVRRYLRDEAVLAAPDTAVQRWGRSLARHRQTTIGLLAALLASLVALGLLGVVGALVAAEYSERASRERERQVLSAVAIGREQASVIDAELFNTESLVAGLAGAAAQALTRPPPDDVPLYLSDTFGTPDGPPDQVQSAHYEAVISMAHADLHVPDGVDLASVDEQLRQLASLKPALRAALLRSENPALERRPASVVDPGVLSDGVLATWTYIGTQQGVLAGYPGIGGYTAGFDPRERPWYRVGFTGSGFQWSALSVEEGDPGLLLTCTLAIHDGDGQRLGVAAADLSFGAFIERFLDPPDLPIRVEAWLVDADGNVIIRSEQKATARTVTEYTPRPFAVDAVLAEMGRSDSGTLVTTVDDERFVFVWTPLSAVSWTYVLQLAEDDLQHL